MGVFDQFPYTNLHETNLSWIIEDMLKLNTAYDNLKKDIQDTLDFINNFEEHADELIANQVAAALSFYYQKLNDLQTQLDDLKTLVSSTVFDDIAKNSADIKQIKQDIINLQMALDAKIFDLNELMHEYKHSIDEIIDGKTQALEQYIVDKVTKLDRLDVVNPLTGIFEDIQNVLDDMAAVITKSYGITAEQYDSLDLTAWEYDSYLIRAEEYSTRGYFALYLKLTFGLMRSPFTGLITTVEDVVTKLTELHKCAITAIEYDNLQLTAADYDFMELPAFAYDWFGWKIVGLIKAGVYDSLQLTAYQYDLKQITALEYERGLKALYNTTLTGVCNNCGDYFILANQITNLMTQVSQIDPITVGAGVTYVGQCDVGQTVSQIHIPTLSNTDRVMINSSRNVLPVKVTVQPTIGVEVEWAASDVGTESLAYTVNVSNKA